VAPAKIKKILIDVYQLQKLEVFHNHKEHPQQEKRKKQEVKAKLL